MSITCARSPAPQCECQCARHTLERETTLFRPPCRPLQGRGAFKRQGAQWAVLGLTTGSTKDLTRLIIRAFLGDADGGMGRPRAEA